MNAPRILLIAGPTASGKTGLSLALAKAVGGEIVNADSMQVYRDLAVLTARPSTEEVAQVPHYLFGHVDGATPYSTGAWAREAVEIIQDIRGRGRTAILVGGTGLYFHALTEGLADIPDPRPEALAAAQDLYEREGIEGLRCAAERLDPEASAGVKGDDRQRLMRIISVATGVGAPLSSFWGPTRPPLEPGSWAGMVLEPPRERLHEAINARVGVMLARGAREEVAALLARDIAADRPVMKALGVRAVGALLAGELDEAAAWELLARDTRRYAKRQMTWLRGRMGDWPRISEPNLAAAQAALSSQRHNGAAT